MSWVEDQGLLHPLGSPGPTVPPVQITIILARDWTRTPDPTGEDGWASPNSPTRPWRTVQKYSHMITYYTPTSRNNKTEKSAFMQQPTQLCNNKHCCSDNHVTRKLSLVCFYGLVILEFIFVLHYLGVGIWLI